jgi:uncharacterized membrane protein
MALLQWMEDTSFSEWILTSSTGWPLMLTIHAIGLAIVVGIVFSMNLRMLGFYGTIPYTSINNFLRIAWIGIVMNVITGFSIFMTQAVSYVTSVPFLTKITFIILGIANLVYMQKVLKREAAGWQAAGGVPRIGYVLAGTSLFFWIVAVITGRLIAYL